MIIWACGYEASLNYSIVDANDIPLPIYIKRGQVEINDLAQVQIMTPPTPSSLATSTVQSPGKALIPLVPQETPVPIGNLLATGLGFGLNVSGDTSSATSLCKADGVAVYLKRAATLILSHVLGPKVFGEGLLTWEQHVVENVRRWNEQQAQIRAMKNQTDSNDLEDSDLEINTSGILSPIHPSRGENKRSVTPSTRSPTAPLVTSPIRRQIRTASSSDISRKKTREGTQLGVSNTSHQKKIPASPVTTSTKKTNPPVEQASTKNQTILQLPLPTVMTKTVNALDNADTDPFDLYLSGVASSSLDNSDNQQNIPPQFSPLQSPKDTLQSADTGDDAPPPPYPVEEFNALSHRPVSQCRSSRDRSSSQESQSNCSTSRSIPLSLSTPITPRNLLVEPTIGRDLSHHPQTPTGWIAPSQSVLSPTIPSSSKTQRVKDPSLSNSVPEKVRATFASPPPNTLHLSSSGLSSQRPTQIKSTGNLPQSSSPFLTSVLGVQPPLHLLPALKLAPSQLSKDKSFHSNRQPVQKSTETSHSHSRTLASLQGVKKLLVAKSSKVS